MADIVKISLVLGVRDFDTAINTTSGFAMFSQLFPASKLCLSEPTGQYSTGKPSLKGDFWTTFVRSLKKGFVPHND
jgi:hypothetical protein